MRVDVYSLVNGLKRQNCSHHGALNKRHTGLLPKYPDGGTYVIKPTDVIAEMKNMNYVKPESAGLLSALPEGVVYV